MGTVLEARREVEAEKGIHTVSPSNIGIVRPRSVPHNTPLTESSVSCESQGSGGPVDQGTMTSTTATDGRVAAP